MNSRRLRQAGSSMIELAIALPVLLILALGAGDFCRAFYADTVLTSAARAGAQYGSQSVITAADSSGMVATARQDGANVPAMAVVASQCTCAPGSTVTVCGSGAGLASYCANNPKATFVEVSTAFTFTTLAPYPGIPASIELSRKAVMEVGQ